VANRTIGHSVEHPAQSLRVEGDCRYATRRHGREGTRERVRLPLDRCQVVRGHVVPQLKRSNG